MTYRTKLLILDSCIILTVIALVTCVVRDYISAFSQ